MSTAKFGGLATIWGPAKFGGGSQDLEGLAPAPPGLSVEPTLKLASKYCCHLANKVDNIDGGEGIDMPEYYSQIFNSVRGSVGYRSVQPFLHGTRL